ALRTVPPDLDAADTRLGALREAVGRAIPADQSSAPQQQAVLRGVLARPEFQPEPQADYGPILGTLLAILWALQRYVDEQAGRLQFRPTLTNREHLVEAPGELRPLLEPLVGRYDRLWYGQSSCAEADYLEFRALATRLREATR